MTLFELWYSQGICPVVGLKGCSTSLVIREMQIKTTMRYHLTPGRMAIIKKARNNKCCKGCSRKVTLLHCWWECKLIQPLWKTVCRFLKKLKIELPFDPAITLLGIYPEKTIIQKESYTTMFTACLLYTSPSPRDRTRSRMPSSA